MFCQKKPARDLKNGQAHCRDEAAGDHLPAAAAIFFLLHHSGSEGL